MSADSDEAEPRRRELDYHCARLLLLISSFELRGSHLTGLTKLAKLDFLLRYPTFLGRLLHNRGWPWPKDAAPRPIDEDAVEARMIRYKYGPWDNRYYQILGTLAGLGLIEVARNGGAMAFRMTPAGAALRARIAAHSEWTLIAARCDLLARRFDWSGSELKEAIYRELPEAVDRPLRTVI